VAGGLLVAIAQRHIALSRTSTSRSSRSPIIGSGQINSGCVPAAARTIETLGVPAASVAAEGRLDELPGIGRDLAGKICTILETGTLPLLRELTAKTPESLVQMLKIPGLGRCARSRPERRRCAGALTGSLSSFVRRMACQSA
jgi:hypothetical protein